jgi:hypothetical protein
MKRRIKITKKHKYKKRKSNRHIYSYKGGGKSFEIDIPHEREIKRLDHFENKEKRGITRRKKLIRYEQVEFNGKKYYIREAKSLFSSKPKFEVFEGTSDSRFTKVDPKTNPSTNFILKNYIRNFRTKADTALRNIYHQYYTKSNKHEIVSKHTDAKGTVLSTNYERILVKPPRNFFLGFRRRRIEVPAPPNHDAAAPSLTAFEVEQIHEKARIKAKEVAAARAAAITVLKKNIEADAKAKVEADAKAKAEAEAKTTTSSA